MNTFWDAVERFLVVVGYHLGDEEIVPEIGWPKGTRLIRGVPGNDPCVPLKDFKQQSQDPRTQDWKDCRTGTLTRDTPLRAFGGTVADIYILHILRCMD